MTPSIPLALVAVFLASILLSPSCLHAFSTTAPPADTNNKVVNKHGDNQQRVVIIGAGVGGLATAARISSQMPNVEVIVLEKNSRNKLGGRCGSFDVNVDGVGAFRHERGPSLLLLKDEYESLFAECTKAETTQNQKNSAAKAYGLDMKQCVPAYQVVFEDGDTILTGFPRSKCNEGLSLDEIKDIQILEQESINKFNLLENNGFQKWQKYLDTCAAFLDCGLPNFIESKLDLGSFPKILVESLKEGGKRWPLQPHSTMLSSLFTSPKMIALASFQDLYVGLSPYAVKGQFGGGILRKTAPAVFGLLAAIELHPTNERAGVFAPIGGFRQVSESMYQLCKDLDVKFKFQAVVSKVTEKGVHFVTKVGGREDDNNGFLSADLVICNADVPYATKTITNQNHEGKESLYQETYDWEDSFDFSTGVIAFHWSLSKSLEALNTHNVFMSANTTNDAENSWAVLQCEDNINGASTSSIQGKPFNFYVHRACTIDETACPPGCDSLMVLVPCPTLMRNKDLASLPRHEAIEAYKQQFNEDYINNVRDAVFERLRRLEGLENVQDLILNEVVDDPATYADYYNVGAGKNEGSFFLCSYCCT